MKKIILLSFLYFPICVFAQKNYFSITGRTFVEEHIVPDQTTKFPLSTGAYIQIKEMPERGWLSDTEGYFKIDSLQKGKYHLTFSCIGLERVDTVILINDNIDLKIILSDLSIHTPQLSLILSKGEENNVLKNNFWDKYGLRVSYYTKESLQDKSQRITIFGYSHKVKRNQIIFNYLDKKYGYSWRFEAPKGIIGLDETLDTYELYSLCFSRIGISQNINKDSVSFVHSYGMIDENDSLSVLLANELYRISVNAKEEKYPLFYGGSYIDRDSIVFLLSNTASFAEIMTIATDNSLPYLRFKSCDVPYKELLNVEKRLHDFYFKRSNRKIIEDIIGWSSWHVSTPDNKILIWLEECTDRNIENFKKYVLNSPVLLFIETDKKVHI